MIPTGAVSNSVLHSSILQSYIHMNGYNRNSHEYPSWPCQREMSCCQSKFVGTKVEFLSFRSCCLFLDQEVDVVDAEGSELLDRALQGHEQPTVRDISVTVHKLVDHCCTQKH